LGPDARHATQADYLNRLQLALQAAQGVGQVLLLGAHLWNPQVVAHSPPQQALHAFNDGLAEAAAAHPNVRLIETAGLLARVGARQAFDMRFYLRAKAPYTAGFIEQLAREIALATRQFGSVFHKVLVLDGDNTLWGGIIGEDRPGRRQARRPTLIPAICSGRVQQQFRNLEAQGVLLCLNSKNNAADVQRADARASGHGAEGRADRGPPRQLGRQAQQPARAGGRTERGPGKLRLH
jgi:hypothetical protein